MAANSPSTFRGAGWTSTGAEPALTAELGQPGGVGQHRHRAALQCVERVAGAVRRGPGQRGEQVARHAVLRAQRHTGDQHIGNGAASLRGACCLCPDGGRQHRQRDHPCRLQGASSVDIGCHLLPPRPAMISDDTTQTLADARLQLSHQPQLSLREGTAVVPTSKRQQPHFPPTCGAWVARGVLLPLTRTCRSRAVTGRAGVKRPAAG